MKHKLTHKLIVTAFLLFFSAVEVMPVVMSCVMGTSCGMVSKKKSCHKNPEDNSISASSCCQTMVSQKPAAEKEIIPAFTYHVILQNDVTELIENPFLQPKQTASYQLPNKTGPPIYLLKQTFLI